MRLYDFLYAVYFKLPSLYGLGIVGKAYRHGLTDSFKWFLTLFYKNKIRNQTDCPTLDPDRVTAPKPLVISLTTYGGRIDVVDIAVKTLLRQSVPVNRIVLWLADDEYSGANLPERVRDLQRYGVEIRYCPDLLAHKKYQYALREFTDAYVITFDDDFFFEKNMIANLLELKARHPDCVITNRAHRMRFQGGRLLPYRQWRHNTTETRPAHQIFATGGVGTLYESRLFGERLFATDALKKLSPKADDVWLKFMTYLDGVKVVTNAR